MKEEMMEILACPLCKGDLVLNIQSKEGNEIIKGTLYCKKCNEYYPIDEGIPNMLPPHLRE
ncbi:methytransferase partner Trm112 [uncultured Methanomethylovorans sp.]|uniref:methytransferase partner Trm112 n=1 Tax=uncultured Methanomethylovorans sp. TaxID=183759 RepID=UPI002AA6D67D|nr:methytransferase partner Trm112 [uncultured Methanomethylovorans sp.]